MTKIKKHCFSYDVIADIDELKWFYDHVIIKPKTGESLYICHFARRKHCTEEEIKELQLTDTEMFHTEISKPRGHADYKWEDFLGSIYKFECNKYAYTTKTYEPYPDKSLVTYIYLNPCSEAACAIDTSNEINNIQNNMFNAAVSQSWDGVNQSIGKLSSIYHYIKSCHAEHPAHKEYIDFDIDWDIKKSDYPKIHSVSERWFGKQNFFMVKTMGGMHVLVKQAVLKFNPQNYIDDIIKEVINPCNSKSSFKKGDIVQIKSTFYKALKDTSELPNVSSLQSDWEIAGEVVRNNNTLCAIPGTWQYGKHCVQIVNKEDFE